MCHSLAVEATFAVSWHTWHWDTFCVCLFITRCHAKWYRTIFLTLKRLKSIRWTWKLSGLGIKMSCRFFVFVFFWRPVDSGGITDSHLTGRTSSTDYNLIGCLHNCNAMQTCWTYCWLTVGNAHTKSDDTDCSDSPEIYRDIIYMHLPLAADTPKTLYVQM